MKTCGEVMTRNPHCCLPNDSVQMAAQMMKKANIGSIPVIDNNQDRRLIGILTDRDLVLSVVVDGRGAKSTMVEEVMTRKVETCFVDDNLQVAIDKMSKFQYRRLPVVDLENKILGIIAQADIAIRVDEPQETAAMVKKISRSDTK